MISNEPPVTEGSGKREQTDQDGFANKEEKLTALADED